MSSGRTPYAETEFLLAVMENRDDDAAKIVGGMLEGEQTELIRTMEDAFQILMDTPPADQV